MLSDEERFDILTPGGHFFSRLVAVLALLGAAPAGGLADPDVIPIPNATAIPIAPAVPAAPLPAALRDQLAPMPDAPAVVAIPPAVSATPAPAPVPVAPAPPALAAGPAVRGVTSANLQAALSGGDPLVLAGRALDQAMLNAVYQAHGYQPVWTDQREQSFLGALDSAQSHGLDASAYKVAAAKPVVRELLLTDAFLRYASALARGRVGPQDFETDWRIDRPAFDPGQVFDAAMAGDVGTVLAALAPHEDEYERLRAALQRYTTLAKTPWHVLFAPTTIQPGDRSDVIKDLRDRLVAEGYLDGKQPAADPSFFGPALSAAVSRFQATHGLPVDGAIGKLTLAALNVSPALRARQIRWNLERWRSLPRIDAPYRIEVNAAAALATLYDANQPVRVMRAIVGAAVHPTPVLRARMNSVLLNPPWVVPSSIIENEIRPMLKRDPNYLQRFGFVYQDIRGGKELVQVPGPTNSLGQVKFEMPNPDDIYMHDTPERQLFALSRRYISHGCVRVEDPRELARILLNSDQWSRDAIDTAIATGQTQSIPLHKSLPVYVLYFTAFVDPDGTVEFRDDVYGRDRRLAEALAARAAADHLAATQDKGTSG